MAAWKGKSNIMAKLTAVVPVRQGSMRLPEKNFKPFGGKNLLEIKIDQLKRIRGIDEIVVNTDSEKAIELAKTKGVKYFRREAYYASSECLNCDHWRNLAETTETDFVMHTLCTSPMIRDDTYDRILQTYRSEVLGGKNDSVNTVREVKKFLWQDGRPLNYETGKAPNSQDLPDIVSLTFGISIIARDLMIDTSNVIGRDPVLFPLDEIEAIDIDTPLEFAFARFLYEKREADEPIAD